MSEYSLKQKSGKKVFAGKTNVEVTVVLPLKQGTTKGTGFIKKKKVTTLAIEKVERIRRLRSPP